MTAAMGIGVSEVSAGVTAAGYNRNPASFAAQDNDCGDGVRVCETSACSFVAAGDDRGYGDRRE